MPVPIACELEKYAACPIKARTLIIYLKVRGLKSRV